MNVIVYIKKKSQSFDKQFISDFLYVENKVFNLTLGMDYFQRKFVDNIYGPSIIIIAYLNDIPVAADALWRNDVDGKKSYQSSDTAVLSECRGKGVFKRMVEEKLSLVESDAIVYGFPNHNSYPGFIKMGWNLTNTYYTSLYTCYRGFKKTNSLIIDTNYLLWWFKGREGYYTISRGCHCFLLAKRNRFVYSIIGEIESKNKIHFPTIGPTIILLYKSFNKSIISKNRIPMRIIFENNHERTFIPTWKMDAI